MNGLDALPRVPLATLPTPLYPAPRLSAELGVDVWFKRDDLTGLGLGGNKARGLEFLVADAMERGCDCIVTGAGEQSNWAALAALAARRCGLEPHLVFYGTPGRPVGNLLLDRWAGATIHYTRDAERSSVNRTIDELCARLRRAGRRPYAIPRGGATALGAVGYLLAGLELDSQLHEAGLKPATLWLATGSCGTQAGLVAAARWLGSAYRVVGVSVSRPVRECLQRVAHLSDGAADLVAMRGEADDVHVLDGYIGPGYGKPSDAGDEATALVARTEGILLDPVFGAKAMAALIAHARSDRLEGPVVFLVTGGSATLFARKGPV